jgi:hypothetical protein
VDKRKEAPSFLFLCRLQEGIRKDEENWRREAFPWENTVFDWKDLCTPDSYRNLRREKEAFARWISEEFFDRPAAFCSLIFPKHTKPSIETVKCTAQRYLDRLMEKIPSSAYPQNPKRMLAIHTAPENHLHLLFELPRHAATALYLRVLLAEVWIEVLTDKGRRNVPDTVVGVLADVDQVPTVDQGAGLSKQHEIRQNAAHYSLRNFIAEDGTTALVESGSIRFRGKLSSSPCVF